MQHSNKLTKDGLILVDFWANPWCGPCRMQVVQSLDKLFEELSEDVLKIVKMDVDEN